MLDDVKRQVPKIVMQEVESDFEENKKKDSLYKRLYSKEELETKATDYYETIREGVQSQSNHDQQLSQIRKAKKERVRNNKNPDGTKKKGKTGGKSQRFSSFWESLDD